MSFILLKAVLIVNNRKGTLLRLCSGFCTLCAYNSLVKTSLIAFIISSVEIIRLMWWSIHLKFVPT